MGFVGRSVLIIWWGGMFRINYLAALAV